MEDGNIQCNLRARFGLETSVYLGGPFPYQGSSEESSHIPAGVGPCVVAVQLYLQSSSEYLIPIAYGQMQWLRVFLRHKS